jgi:hypothetical protein
VSLLSIQFEILNVSQQYMPPWRVMRIALLLLYWLNNNNHGLYVCMYVCVCVCVCVYIYIYIIHLRHILPLNGNCVTTKFRISVSWNSHSFSGVFNDVFYIGEHIAWNGRMANALERFWKSFYGLMKILSWQLPEGPGENYEKPQPR